MGQVNLRIIGDCENFEGKSRVIKRFFENSKVQGCCGKDRGGNRLNFCFKIYPIRFEDIIIIRNFIDEC